MAATSKAECGIARPLFCRLRLSLKVSASQSVSVGARHPHPESSNADGAKAYSGKSIYTNRVSVSASRPSPSLSSFGSACTSGKLP
jgi:hypothetical protein